MRVKRQSPRETAVLLSGSAIYALLYALGSQTDQGLSVAPGRTALRFACALSAAALALHLLFAHLLPRLALSPDEPGKHKRPFCTWGACAFIFGCYVPLFLITYPGSFTYDSMKQVQQIASGQYDPILPLLHTLYIRFCLSFYEVLGSMELCGALCSVLQMGIMSACFAQTAASLSRSVSRNAGRIAAGFFALYPAHMAFASNCTKDGMFACFLTLFLALCFEESGGGRLFSVQRVLRVMSGVAACLLRNNMIYAMAAWVLVLLLWRRRYRKLLAAGALVTALAFSLNTGMNAMTGASGGRVSELLSVPLQQLARARLYSPESFDEEALAFVDGFLVDANTGRMVWQDYEPTVADPVKNWLDDSVVREKLPELFSVWLGVMKKCPGVYMDAFMELALPSLYPYTAFRVAHSYIEVATGPALTAPYGLAPFTQPARFEALRNWLRYEVFERGADDHGVLRWIFNIGLINWVLLLFALHDAYRGDKARLTLLLLPALLWLPYLFGPVMQGRYLYPFVCMLPVFVLRRKNA